MNIERITLCNITSIEGEFIIDFNEEPLRSADLFAITGSTGAGKSSILDAICVALYDKVPRFEHNEALSGDKLQEVLGETQCIGSNDTRSLLRRGARLGYVYVCFRAADGQCYEARWVAGLTKNDTQRPVEHTLFHIDKKGKETQLTDKKTDTLKKVIEILGLDYQQFSRTVILAQNSFAAFLQAKSKDKSTLLEKLTGVEIYGKISQRIFELYKESEERVTNLEAKRSGVLMNQLSAEDQLEFSQRVDHLTQTLVAHEEEQTRIKAYQDWYLRREQALQRVLQTTEAHSAINKDYLALRGEEQQLDRYDQVQVFRELHIQIQDNERSIDQLKAREAENTQQSKQQELRVHEAQQQQKLSHDRWQQAETILHQRQPDIALGHTLEGEMSNIKTVVDESANRLKALQLQLEQRTTTFETHQKEEARLLQELESLQLKHQKLAIHKGMFEHYQTINEKLSRYAEETKRNDTLQAENKKVTQQKRELLLSLEQTQKELQKTTEFLQVQRAQRTLDEQAIQGIDASIYRTQNQLQQRLALLAEARRLWQRLVKNYELATELSASIERQSRQLNQRCTDQKNVQAEKDILAQRHDELHRAYLLSQSTDIKELRQHLKEGMQCPVCGSAHHPFNTEIEQELGEKQAQMKHDYEQIQALYRAKKAELESIDHEILTSQSSLDSDRKRLDDLRSDQQAMEQEWTAFAHLDNSFGDCNASVNRHARNSYIDMQLDSGNQQLESLNKNIERYEQYNARIQSLSQTIEQAAAKEQQLNEAQMVQKSERTILSNRLQQLQRDIDTSNQIHEQLYKTLDDLLTMSGWRDEDIDIFKKRLAKEYEDWQQLNERIQHRNRDLALTQQQLLAQNEVLNELKRNLSAERENHERQRETLNAKREELLRLFGEETPAALSHRLKQQCLDMHQHYNQLNQAYLDQLTRLQHLQGERTNLATDRRNLEDQLRERTTKLDQAIARFNLTNTPLRRIELDQLFADPRDWNALRQKINQTRDLLNSATQSKNEAEQAYLAVTRESTRPSEHAEDQPEALAQRMAQLVATTEQIQSERNLLQEKLRAHETSLANAASIGAEIEAAQADAIEWNRLKELFGSADGKRLRDIAQSYTFGLLVEHANHHLQQLSPRYLLDVLPGTLALEVIDKDLLNERRFVASLSGGETFIVSLSLALGLASLSGTLLNIGNLFIDEGFGNLDESSLALVLDSLSRLQTQQGRRVGVVSHTEQIRHQIRPQIQLVKQPGTGRSSLQIVG